MNVKLKTTSTQFMSANSRSSILFKSLNTFDFLFLRTAYNALKARDPFSPFPSRECVQTVSTATSSAFVVSCVSCYLLSLIG